MYIDTFQMAVETPDDRVRLIRVAGDLSRTAAASLLRLIDAQLHLIAARHFAATDLVVDLENVHSFEPGGLEAVRHARHSTDAQGVRIHLTGCSGRFHLLPLRTCQILGEFSTFPTAEIALEQLADAAAATSTTGRARGPAEPAQPPEHRHDGPGDANPAARSAPALVHDAAVFPPPRLSPEREPTVPRTAGPTTTLCRRRRARKRSSGRSTPQKHDRRGNPRVSSCPMSVVRDSAEARARLRLAAANGRALPDGRTGLALEADRPEAYDPRPDLDQLAVAYQTTAVRLPRMGWLPRLEVHFRRSDIEASRQADAPAPPRTG